MLPSKWLVFIRPSLLVLTDHLPDAWLKRRPNGSIEFAEDYVPLLPSKIYYDEFGRYSEKESLKYWGGFMPARLLFAPTAGIFYDTKTNESTKLTALGYEGPGRGG